MKRFALALLCVVVSAAIVPRKLCGRNAEPLFDGELGVQDRLARRVARAVLAEKALHFYQTGSARFDGQSAIAIYQMALLGLGQIVLAHPERRDEYLPAMRLSADRLANPKTLEYAARVWGRNGVVAMGPGQGHAYLGYVNLGLGMLRAVDPATPHAALNDRLTDELERRLFAAPTGLVETYPGETWPPDVSAVAGSIGLRARVAGLDRREAIQAWAERFSRCAIHASGYLVQRTKSGGCAALDAPRGSGTAIAAYFLSFADRSLALRLEQALVTEGRRTLFGFGALREYARGHSGSGDVNAGPILLGVSVGATGFGLGAARAAGDRQLFVELYRTLSLFGVPAASGAEDWFSTGGVLGNALLLAMLTAQKS